MPHFERHRSRSYDQSTPRRQFEEDEENKRVHFDDGRIGCNNPRRGLTRPEIPRRCSIQETTTKLKQSYENIEKGLDVLQNLKGRLHKYKQPIPCVKCHSSHENKGQTNEIERILDEIDQLQKLLERTGLQKRKYLQELSKLQNALHRDRKKMEGYVKSSNNSNKKIKSKIEETSRKTRDQQVLITKLKEDNSTLWKTLQDIQEHLRKENSSDIESLASIDLDDEMSAKKLPQKPNYENMQHRVSIDNLQNGSEKLVNMSYDSTNDNYLSDKLKSLIHQSNNIQKLISNVGTSECKVLETQHYNYERYHGSDVRIPSENEKGERSDMNDIMRRCEDLERRVDECSTSDIRQTLMQQLNDMESISSSEDVKENYTQGSNIEIRSFPPNPNLSWKPDHHKKVRNELLKCLDKIVHLEKSFKTAQDEIQRLRRYIQETAQEKEFSEKTYKREALELRLLMDERNKEIDLLKQDVNDALQELKGKDTLLKRIGKLEDLLEEKDMQISEVKAGNESDMKHLKRTLTLKNRELSDLKEELNSALQSMENLRLYDTNSTTYLQTQVKELGIENNKLRASLQENINEELSCLQIAVHETENQIKDLTHENEVLKQNIVSKDKLFEDINTDNNDLIKRLKQSEEEIRFLQSRSEMLDKEFGFSTIASKDNQINQLQLNLETAITEKQLAINDLEDNRNEFEEKLNQAINESTLILSENEVEIKRLQNELQKCSDEKQIAYNALTNQDQEIKKLENKLQSLTSQYSSTTPLVRFSDNISKSSVEHQTKNTETYVEVLHYKDEIISSLRGNIDILAGEIEKYAMRDTQKNNDKDLTSSDDIVKELQIIRKSMSESHTELIDKILGLKKELRLLQSENKTLRESNSYSTSTPENETGPSPNLLKLQQQNSLLKEALETSYPGLVDNVLANTEKLKALLDENSLLRIALSQDRIALVDSNLRKRERIKRLENQMSKTNNDPPPHKLNRRRRSSSVGDVALLDEENNENHVTKTRDEILAEMINQNHVIVKLQRQNEKRDSENEQLKKERDDLKAISRSNQALENELNSLRNTLKHIGQDMSPTASKRKIKALEAEVEKLKARKSNKDGIDGISYDANQMFTFPLEMNKEISDLKDQVATLTAENHTLKQDLENATHNLHRLANIIDRGQNEDAKENILDKRNIKKIETKLAKMNDENERLKFSLNNAQNELDIINEELVNSKENLHEIKIQNEDILIENDKLNAKLSEEKSKSTNKHELNNTIETLNHTIGTLKIQNGELQEEINEIKFEKDSQHHHRINDQNELNILEKNNEILTENIKQLHVENQEIDHKNKCLQSELEMIREGITEQDFMDWLDKDVDKRMQLLSPDAQYTDGSFDSAERKHKRDATRVAHKLQIENQVLRCKLLKMEEEAVATIKLMADMERGHGHLTGTLRSHLILQKNTTMKILEGSLQQYTCDFETLKKKFKSLEEKYNSEKKCSKPREYAWDMFTNALATINNINTILHEGLIKVEEDLQKDLSDNDFENKDYKSRLWILRRRLSDVENRHRESQLRAEELNLRLDAKQTEFEVTQDELEGTTRDLESRETNLYRLKNELDKIEHENKHLQKLIESLKDNQHKTIGDVFKENEKLRNTTKEISKKHSKDLKTMETSFDDMTEQFEQNKAALKVARKMRDESNQEVIELKKRISVLERRLTEITDQRDKLKKEADNRAGYLGNCRDDHGTIHMLRDDIKQLAKENADLKQDIVLKHRQMYGMSKDLHQLKMEKDIKKLDLNNKSNKAENVDRLINDMAELKAEKFLLETRLQDIERRKNKTNDINQVEEESFIENSFKTVLISKEKEIEKMKFKNRDIRNDTMSDLGGSVFDTSTNEISRETRQDLHNRIKELQDENAVLQNVVTEKNLSKTYDIDKEIHFQKKNKDHRESELELMKKQCEEQQQKIRELMIIIDAQRHSNENRDSNEIDTYDLLSDKNLFTSEREKEMLKIIDEKDEEINDWKSKADTLETELKRVHNNSRISTTDDDKFQKLYLNKKTPDGTQQLSTADSYLDMNLQPESSNNVTRMEYNHANDAVRNHSELRQPSLPSHSYDHHEQQEIKVLDKQRVKSNIPSRIPISPNKKRKSVPVTKPNQPDSASVQNTMNQQTPYTKQDQENYSLDQIEEVQMILKSSDAYSTEQVNSILILLEELLIYRTTLCLTKHETLPILGREKLNRVIEYQLLNKERLTEKQFQDDFLMLTVENETIKQEYDTLQNRFVLLQNEFTDLKLMTEYTNQTLSNRSSVENQEKDLQILALAEKNAIRTDENLTLQELLETQTQNVKSQESVIKTLKKDIKLTKTKFNKEYDTVFQELRTKKIELRDLKKENKELKKSKQKESKEAIAKNMEEFSDKDYFINELQSEINDLHNTIEKLKSKEEENQKTVELLSQKGSQRLHRKEQEFEEVLQYAESALEDAKRKLNETSKENDELKIKIDELESEKHRDKEVFNDVKNELKTALNKKIEFIKNITKELADYKESKEKELKTQDKKITDLQKQCNDYRLILTRSESTTSYLNSQLSSLEKTYDIMKASFEDLKSERDHLLKENDNISSKITAMSENTLKTNDFSLKTDATFITDSTIPQDVTETSKYNELEIEYEILKGCNEHLEETVNQLTEQIKEYENVTKVKNNEHDRILHEHQQIKKDLEKSLEFLREIDQKNEELNEVNNTLNENKKQLEKHNIHLTNQIKNIKENEISDMQNELLKSVSINEKDQVTINELETVIDDFEREIKRRDDEIELMKHNELDTINKYELKLKKHDKEYESLAQSLNNVETELNTKINKMLSEIDYSNKEKSKVENILALKENEFKLIEQESGKNKKKMKDLHEVVSAKSKQIENLENNLQNWIKKANEKEREMNKFLVKESNELKEQNINNDISDDLTNQISLLTFDIANKNSSIKTLQKDLESQHEQYTSVLNALNKRREESKLFLAMQDKLQNEIERKEDIIKKIKFKMKANDLDLSMDQLDAGPEQFNLAALASWADEDEISNKDDLILDQRQGLHLLTEQLYLLRERNQSISTELEKLRTSYLELEVVARSANYENKSLKNSNGELKDKLKELRHFIQESPNTSFSDENKAVHLQTKLYTAYKELREKSIEIATLKMNEELRQIEIDNLKQQISKSNSKKHCKDKRFTQNVKCNHSLNIQSLVNEIQEHKIIEQRLREENTQVKESLFTKTKEFDLLTLEFSNVIEKLKLVESNLMEEDKYLKARYVYGSEENSDISEITSITPQPSSNSMHTKENMARNISANDTFLLDGFAENSLSESSQIKPQSLNKIATDNEIQYLKRELQNKTNSEEKLKMEIKELTLLLQKTRDELKTKENKLFLLEDQLNDLETEDNDELKKYREKCFQYEHQNKSLKDQLSWQQKRFEIELDTLRVTLTNLKDEHVNSLKNDLEGTSKEKIILQVKVKDIENNLSVKERKINSLLKTNEDLLDEVKKKNEELSKFEIS